MLIGSNIHEQFLTALSALSVINHQPVLRRLRELPPLMQSFLLQCGHHDDQPATNAAIFWRSARMRKQPYGKWRSTSCKQFNRFDHPVRLAYLRQRLLGLFSLAAFDRYNDGHGRMAIHLLNYIRLADFQGIELDRSGLVTFLSELIICPLAALCPAIQWQEDGPLSVRATISDHGLSASGRFIFNAGQKIIRFESDDRYLSVGAGSYLSLPWIVDVGDYRPAGVHRLPVYLSASWVRNGKVQPYFQGDIGAIYYNRPELLIYHGW